MTNENNKLPFFLLFKVGLTCIFLGGFIGAITNMINGAISPNYFRIVMGWDFPDIWIASVCQGIFEGVIYGVIFSLFFTTAFAIITKGKESYSFAIKQLLKVFLIVISCWKIGGFLALLFVKLLPELYQSLFYHVPSEKTEMLKYAWVGGSIWGGMIGCILSTFFAVFFLKNNQKNI